MNRLYYKVKNFTGLLIILLFLITICTATTPTVIREIHPVSNGEGDVSHIRLQIQGFDMGGIIETLPSGMTFQSSSMPEKR